MLRRLFLWSERVKEIVANGLLYDFYGELLTEHQRNLYGDAVNEDMSLNEIAERYEISRQAAHDLIKRCTKTMMKYEDKLHMVQRFGTIRTQTERLRDLVRQAGREGYSDRQLLSVAKKIDEALEL